MAEANKSVKKIKTTATRKKSNSSENKKIENTITKNDVNPKLKQTTDNKLQTTSKTTTNKNTPAVAPAKAGKRSAKAIKEKDEILAKEERKTHPKLEAGAEKRKITQKPTRSRLERRSKNFRKSAELIDKNKEYQLKDAVELAIKTSTVKFDATIEMHINLNVDPRQADQNVRGNLVLPAGTGKTMRVAVLAEPSEAFKAKKAGADIAGSDDFLQQLDKGIIDFDILISAPANMAKLGKYARLLGPKGLMPNPKSGTVTNNVEKAVKESKAGKVEYRVDSTGIVHLGIGKISFGIDKLEQNARAVLDSINAVKPASIKGGYVNSIFITSSMGPSIKTILTL